MTTALVELKRRLAEVSDVSRAAGVLGWDQRVTMPPRGTDARADQLATLGRIAHERFVDDEVGRLLDDAEPQVAALEHDSDDASLVRVTRRDWEKARRVPADLHEEMTREGARGHHAWVEARRDDDYAPGMLTTEVRDVFAVLRPALSDLVASAPEVDASFLKGDFVPDDQRAFAERVLDTLGFDEGAWRLDPTAHPFCTSFSNRDVRLTTRYRPDDLESVWSTLHEAGHGLYAHGIADSLMRTPLGGAPSLGVNESQSRTWENLVGRSRPFWAYWYEPLQETFPAQLGDVELDAFVRAINRAEPGLIRVDADETTYSLHIILRFELEQELIAGTVALDDLPEIWNARMKEFLGVDVPSNTDGVLQDVHWSGGGIGYFPTYALGNVISLQIWAKVQEALPDLDDQLAAGDLMQLSDWLRDNLYAWGRKLTPKETLGRLTGSDAIDPQPYLAYLGDKMAQLAPA